MLLHSFIIAWPCVTLFLILSRTEGVPLCIISAEHQLVIFLQQRSKAISPTPGQADLWPWPQHQHPSLCAPPRELHEQREWILVSRGSPHGGLQINDWGSHVLQAFMHHAQFTGEHVTECSQWEFQEFQAIPAQHWHNPAQRQRQTEVGVVGRGLTVWLHTWVHSGDRVARWLP